MFPDDPVKSATPHGDSAYDARVASRARRRIAMALGLVLLAPTVGEFLLGNVPVSQYASVLVLAPLYGGGALLVRETARRLRRGWPTITLFAAAYALVEEGPVDQMVFNPGYLGLGSFAGYAEIPGLGISGTLVLWSLALHTVWSICVPIALVEAFDPTPTEPWLGRIGYTVTVLVFVVGCVLLGWAQADELHFVGSASQFLVSAVAIAALVGGGLLLRQPLLTPVPAAPPAPILVAVAAFAVTSGYWLSTDLPVPGVGAGWVQVAVFGAAGALAVSLVLHWSRRERWDGRHRVALAAGAAATYASWFGLVQAGEAGTGRAEAIVGAVVFGTAALVLVVLAYASAYGSAHGGRLTGATNRRGRGSGPAR